MNGTLQNENTIVGTLSGRGSVTGGIGTVFGKDGKSAYEIAVKNGFEGTETEWLASLIGANGKDGVGIVMVRYFHSVEYTRMDITLSNGTEYSVFIKNGIQGEKGEKGDAFTYSDFTPEQLAALKGADGYTPQKGVDYFDGVDGKDGTDGKTPVKGVDYIDGVSAYEVAVKNGFEGTEAEWLESLKGVDGKDGLGIVEVEQVKTSDDDGGTNVMRITLTDGSEQLFIVRNGSKGSQGEKGDSGVYLGTGDMPDDCNVQIDPDGIVTDLNELVFNNLLLRDKTTGTTYELYVENSKLCMKGSKV